MANIPTSLNNPGDLRFAGQTGASPSSKGFAQFKNPTSGGAALLNDLQAKINAHPDWNLVDFSKVYAPSSDGNNPAQYAANIANQLGVTPGATIGSLQKQIGKFAEAVAHNEGYNFSSQQTSQSPVAQGQQTPGLPNMPAAATASSTNTYTPGLPTLPTAAPVAASPQASGTLPISSAAQSQGLGSQYLKDINNVISRATAPSIATQQLHKGEFIPAIGSELSRGLGMLSPVASAINQTAAGALGLIPGVPWLEKKAGQGIGAAAATPAGQTVISAADKLAQQYPELAHDLGYVGNIGGAGLALSGAAALKDLGTSAIAKGLGRAGEDSVTSTVAPVMTPKQAAAALAQRDTQRVGLLGRETLKPSQSEINMSNAVKQYVPKFNPSKPLTYNIAVTRNAATKLGNQIKNEVDTASGGAIYPFKQLSAYLHSLPIPLSVTRDMEPVYNRVIDLATQSAKDSGGKVSDLLSARKKFDAEIAKQFPNLYSSDAYTPIRTAVKNVRNAMTRFTIDQLPKDIGLDQKLLDQHRLLTAIENMSEKATKGPTKELGSTAVTRFAKAHPLITGIAKRVGRGAEYAPGFEIARNILP